VSRKPGKTIDASGGPELEKLQTMIEKLEEKKDKVDEKNAEMKAEIKTLIRTIKDMETALNAKGQEAEKL